MGGARKLSPAVAAALCAAVLVACGGGGDDTTSNTATDLTTAESTGNGGGSSNKAAGGDEGSKDKGGGGSNGGGSNGSGSNGSGGGSPGSGSGGGGAGGGGNFDFTGEPTKHKHPKPEEGKRSDVFLVPGGDNSIQEYGEEQDEDERVAAMAPIAALYRALLSGDWTEVCNTYLSAPNLEQIKLVAEKSPQVKGKGCAEVLGGLNQSVGRKGPDTPDGALVAFRVEGDTGFAIYWGIDGKGYAFPLKSENGEWKLTSLAPTPLQF